MRGRKPDYLLITAPDQRLLEDMARRRTLSWFQVQRARILLAMAAGERVQTVASRMSCDPSTVWRVCRRYQQQGLDSVRQEAHRTGRPARISPLERAQIVALACLEPVAKGLHITHWSSRDLARQAVLDGGVPAMSARTVRRILHEVDLQPHRTRYWKTACLDQRFKHRAEQILWCYAHADHLLKKGVGVVCVDEMPNLQALERQPIRRAILGSIEQQEFEYRRHGTVNVLLFLVVATGQMYALCPARKDALHYIEALEQFRHRYRYLRGVLLIQNGDSSHTAKATQQYFARHRWWRPRWTPVHASWLNQGELLNDAFSYRYLKRCSWPSRQALIDHIAVAWSEYNQLYAHPFQWTWTNQKMRQWFAQHVTHST